MDTSIIYIHNKPESFKSKFFQSYMTLAGFKNQIEKRFKKNKFSHESKPIPNSLRKKCDINIKETIGHKFWTLKPKEYVSEKVILYLHGGAYISNITGFHWNLIEELLIKTNATIVIPDYPLIPNANYKDVYNFVEVIYYELLSKVSSHNIIFMGDSAGGGLALGFAQELRNKNKPQPSQIILLSPWLDITMSNSDIIKIDKRDKMLGIKGLKMAGQAYAGTIDSKNFKVSPIYGDFSDLGKISVFIGTHDLFIADARKLRSLMLNENISLNYFEYPKMFHVWVAVTGMKESKYAIDQMVLLIKNEYK
jgi:acetyl esterase/lipase